MAASAPVAIDRKPQSDKFGLNAIVKSGVTIHRNAMVSLIGVGHSDIATLGGQAVALTCRASA